MNALRHKVYLAGLLHDIGKFYQRADIYNRDRESYFEMLENEYRNLEPEFCPSYKGRYSHKHVLWTAQFIGKVLGLNEKKYSQNNPQDTESLLRLASKHHNPSSLSEWIITLADHLSSSMDRNKVTEDVKIETDWGKYKDTPLLSIFETVGKTEAGNQRHYRLPVSILDANHIMPVKKEEIENMEQQYKEIWENFEKELKKVYPDPDILLQDKNAVETLYYLMEKYLINIPSSTMDIPDISLFDHSKTTAAFALSLYDYVKTHHISDVSSLMELKNNDKKAFLLLGTDLSGIQKYLYQIKSKYAAKNLKGRSFMLHLIMTGVAKKILDELDMYQSNMIYNSGGTFFMLLPNTPEVAQKLNQIFEEVEKEFLKKFGTHLFLAHGTVPFSMKDVFMGDINQIWNRVFEKINEHKRQSFKTSILNNYENFFEPFGNPHADKDSITGEEITGEPIKKESMILNPITWQQVELGKKLKKAKYWYIIKGGWSNKETDMDFLGYAHLVTEESISILEDLENVTQLQFNDTNFAGPHKRMIQGFEFYGGNDYPADKDGNPKTFDLLTKGNYNKLGVVRMDVDNLGYLFKNGFTKKQRTFGRYASLSRNLDLFFRAHINHIWKRNPTYKDHVFILYSGGDDLFVLGDWDIVREFAEEIRNEFRKFVCYNPYITISGGELITPPKYPILKSAEQAGEVESLAKNYTYRDQKLKYRFEEENGQEIVKELPKQKDAFSFLHEAMGWEAEYPLVKNKAKELLHKIEEGNLPKSILQKLMDYYLRNKEPRTTWLMSYDFSRMANRYKNEKEYIHQILKDILNNTWERDDNPNNFTLDSFLMYSLAARWAELLYRNKNN
jgi:CRISPR-associated protein Csm1